MTPLQIVHLVKCNDEAIFCAGPQRGSDGESVPGGPLAYESREDAERMATAIDGTTKRRMLYPLKRMCIEKRVVLWLRHVDGRHSYFADTIPRNPADLVPIEGDERRAAIQASHDLPL